MTASNAAVAASGDNVKIHYTGRLVDGTQFDSSRGTDPLEVTLGRGETIPGFEQAVVGMTPGEQKTITIPCDAAYGERDEDMVQTLPRSMVPPEVQLEVGMMLGANGPEGQTLSFTVAAFDDESLTVDGNHPLAGQDLVFDLELVAIGQ